MNILRHTLATLESFHLAQEKIKERQTPLGIYGAIDSQKCHLIGELTQYTEKIIVTYNEVKAREIYEDMLFFQKDVFLYPSKDIIFYSADVHSNDIAQGRMIVFKQLIEKQRGTIILSVEALVDHLLERTVIEESIINIEVGKDLNRANFGQTLIYMGYKRVDQVERRGQFTLRGGIIDIYPLTEKEMVRIELWGDTVDSIRQVNHETQRSTTPLEAVTIYPAREIVVAEPAINHAIKAIEKDYKETVKYFVGKEGIQEQLETTYQQLSWKVKSEGNFNGIESNVHYYYETLVSLLDYFKDPIIFLDEPARIKERLDSLYQEFRESMQNRYIKGYFLKSQVDILYGRMALNHKIQTYPVVSLSSLNHKENFIQSRYKTEMQVKSTIPYHNSFELLIKDIHAWVENHYKIVLLSASRTRVSRMVELLRERDIKAYEHLDMQTDLTEGTVAVTHGSLHRGFIYPQIRLVVLTETEVVGKKKKYRRKKFKEGKKLQSFEELKPGDYVVHESHGVGIFEGIEKIEMEGVGKDYIKIAYKGDGNLYVATGQLDVIQKYISGAGRSPKINRLGTGEWKKTKVRVQQAVEEIADELVELYAQREEKKGYQYEKDTLWQREFEEIFPYDETDDQLMAIEATKKDMESSKIMDRLICGDVGYGKTEVAIRAAFKAVQDNKQVAYLVPTTILAQQQYNNFVQRMKDFPINVAMLSRFRTAKEQKIIIKELKKGGIDIVIGTHRLVSKDVIFKDLGLLIIDEEQRFGVKHKEAIKQIKNTVDVMTLTATPIPRTLHMSLIGIRDMSVLEDPPEERHPIQTYVLEYNDALVKDAIYRELARDGQVYYVHNRVKDMDQEANKVALMVPEANVAYAHGQMSERELENIMFDFINGEIDVLVATTIIETGLDISNVNTMIIQDADRMGLAQLYQLRGRVGRSNRVAYAYLMYKRDKVLKEVAEKRLEAIREFTEFGAGFKIAMRDLEIRGAGNLLGAKQHGHMDAVGYDLYCKMLEKEVKRIQNGVPEVSVAETTVDIQIDAYIPGTYIEDEVRKIEAYKKIAMIETEEEFMDVQDELMDRYGEMPSSVINLLTIARIKAQASHVGVLSIQEKRENYLFEMKEDAQINPGKIPKLLEEFGQILTFTVAKNPYFSYKIKGRKKGEGFKQIKNLLAALKKIHD